MHLFRPSLAVVWLDTAIGKLLEAKKGWTDAAWRRQGIAHELLQFARCEARVMSDRDGMTDGAYAQWRKTRNVELRWWDDKEQKFVQLGDVPPHEVFDYSPAAARWRW